VIIAESPVARQEHFDTTLMPPSEVSGGNADEQRIVRSFA
jgi:hypothetical protein